MPRQTKFSEQWLSQVDTNKHTLKLWCKPDVKDIYAGYCILCHKKLPCDNMGVRQILQHATGSKHTEIACARFSKSDQHLAPSSSTSKVTSGNSNSQSNTVSISTVMVQKSHLDQVSTAEVLWALKLVESDIPFSACDNVKELFRAMFPNEPVVRDFSCGATKTSYLITFGLAPYFKEQVISDIKSSNTGYTLHYDETTTSQVKKQMDIVVRYWSLKKKQVVVQYLASLFFGHAAATTVTTNLLDFVAENGIPLNKLLTMSSDGPNVNKAISDLMNKALSEAHLPNMVEIGTCNLHKVHNAFGKSLAVFGSSAEELALKLFYWFKHSAARRADFKDVQFYLDLDDVFLLRHVSSRWLSLQPAVERILSQWCAITKYFKELPSVDGSVRNNEPYKAIVRLLDDPHTFIQLQFVADVAPVFSRFLQLFQSEGPLVHLLHDALCNLIRTLMLRFLKTEAIGSKTGRELTIVDVKDIENLRPLDDMEIGEATRKSLIKVKKEQHKGVLLDMRNFLVTSVQYLQRNLPLSNSVLQDLRCLDAAARTKSDSEVSIRRLAGKLPQVVTDEEISTVTDEWKLYSVDDIPTDWYAVKQDSTTTDDLDCTSMAGDSESIVAGTNSEDESKGVKSLYRVDEYWSKVLDIRNAVGQLKYPTLGKVVMACLALAHGNADVERSFSVNKRTVSSDRACLSEETINAVRLVKDAIRCHAGGSATAVAVTPLLLQNARSAYTKYKLYLEEKQKLEESRRQKLLKEKKQTEAEEQKKKEYAQMEESCRKDLDQLQKEESEISATENEQHNLLHGAGVLLKEAETKLSDAIKAGNMDQISVAHGLLEVARKRMDFATGELSKLAAKRKVCHDKKKRHLDFLKDNNQPKHKQAKYATTEAKSHQKYKYGAAKSSKPHKHSTAIAKSNKPDQHVTSKSS